MVAWELHWIMTEESINLLFSNLSFQKTWDRLGVLFRRHSKLHNLTWTRKRFRDERFCHLTLTHLLTWSEHADMNWCQNGPRNIFKWFHASPLCLTFSIHFILLFLHCSHPPGANYDMQTLQSLESQDFNYNIQSMPVSDDFLEFLLPTWHFTASCLETVGLRQKKRERHLMSLTNAAWWILLPPGSLLPALVQSTTSWLPILWLTINRHYSQVL